MKDDDDSQSEIEGLTDPEVAPDDVLCPTCLRSNSARQDFCARCGAPLSFMATVDPLKQTLSEGFAYRQAVDGPSSRIVLVGVWLLFLPGLVTLPAILMGGGQEWAPLELAPCFIAFPLSLVVLYRATANYLHKRREPSLVDQQPLN